MEKGNTPQYGFQPQSGQVYQPQTVIINAPPRLGPGPQSLVCPTCKTTMSTRVKHENVTKTHVWALVLCCFGCVLGCCLIPYCMDSCKGTVHTCSSCGNYIGKSE